LTRPLSQPAIKFPTLERLQQFSRTAVHSGALSRILNEFIERSRPATAPPTITAPLEMSPPCRRIHLSRSVSSLLAGLVRSNRFSWRGVASSMLVRLFHAVSDPLGRSAIEASRRDSRCREEKHRGALRTESFPRPEERRRFGRLRAELWRSQDALSRAVNETTRDITVWRDILAKLRGPKTFSRCLRLHYY